jgi:hypothetical protein
VLTSVRKLLEGANKDNEDIFPQKANLEKVKSNIQVFTLFLEGEMLDRKSLQGAYLFFEIASKGKKTMRRIVYL